MGRKEGFTSSTRRRPLTEAEKKLVEENHNLIYSYASTHNLQLDDINTIAHNWTTHENWYGVLAEALCHAVKTWDKSKSSLSSWAYLVMDSRVTGTKKSYRLHNPNIIGSLESMEHFGRSAGNSGSGKKSTTFLDSTYFTNGVDGIIDSTLDSAEIRLILEKEYKKMGKYEILCRKVLEEGCQISEISKQLGVTRQMGSYEYSKVFLPRVRQKLSRAFNIN